MNAPSIFWPIYVLPICRTVGQFPMSLPACNDHSYRHTTFALHLHDYAGMVKIAGRTFHLRPGDLTLTPPNSMSRYKLLASGTHLCVHFDPPREKGNSMRLPLHFQAGPRTAAARERIWRVIDHARLAGRTAAAAASASLLELLLWLHAQSIAPRTALRQIPAEMAITRLLNIIDESIGKQRSIPELASEAGLTVDYLARLFRRRHGMSISRYLLLRRIELARHLLRSTRLPVRDVGSQAGIPDAQYFNKQFRRVVGRSPSAYRLETVSDCNCS